MNKPRVPVTLTKGQHEIITKAADAVGLTISAYLRFAALEKASGFQGFTRPEKERD